MLALSTGASIALLVAAAIIAGAAAYLWFNDEDRKAKKK